MLRPLALALLLACAAAPEAQDRQILFPDVPGLHTMVVDLHTHTVFSDGDVWPTIRVQEARRDGLDALAITDHLELLKRAPDVPGLDRNRSAEIALEASANGASPLLVIRGAEITREQPYGHANAVFIEDANALLLDSARDVFAEARRQGAFTFITHPAWTTQRKDAIARLTDEQRQLVADSLVQGIEVVNDQTYSDEALQLALDFGLAILGTSDLHGVADWTFHEASGGHRPVTLVLAPERSASGLRAGLDAGRTVALFKQTLIGRERDLLPLLWATLGIGRTFYNNGGISVLNVELVNRSTTPLLLENRSAYALHNGIGVITVPAEGSVVVRFKTLERVLSVPISFAVLNAVTAPGEHPVLSMEVGSGMNR